ncbi:GNAT family N-acetyltransferase [Risungbinella massiliensis]|uniref:GNAT family N-acetyltransferase n=1 Tax=Risungbinella massiliensis TaxID=1329796 RepID=UPI00069ABFAF|nr:GNAT family protein [Risungbinella massiliensis]
MNTNTKKQQSERDSAVFLKWGNIIKIVIREANKTDAVSLFACIQEVLANSPYLPRFPDELQVKTIEQEEIWIEKQKEMGILLVAVADGKIVGSLNLSREKWKRTRHVGEFGISVLPSYQNKGIGRKLMGELLTWVSKKTDLRKIRLRVMAQNVGAIHLYKSFGFQEEGRLKEEISNMDGTYDDTIWMGLHLQL